MGKKSDGGKAALLAESRASMNKAADAINAVDLPDIELMKLALEEDALVGELQAENLGDTAMSEISLDPRYKSAQLAALESLQAKGRTGLDATDRMALEEINRSAGSQEQARQASILQGMAERGNLDSGSQLAAQLSSSQAATDRARQQGNVLGSQALEARRQALEAAGSAATQLRGQDYGEQSNLAKSRDVINQFNTQNRQNVNLRNLDARQGISSGNVNLRNQQQQYNKGLQQQQFSNEMQKAGALGNIYGSNAQGLQQQAAMAQGKPGWGGIIGTAVGAAVGGYAGSKSGQGAQGAQAGAQIGGATGSQFADGGAKVRVDEAVEVGMLKPNIDAQKELLAIARGDIMPEDSSSGRIIGGNDFAGDQLPDRINSGEMVMNLGQQDKIKKDLDSKSAQNNGFLKILEMLGKK